MTKGTLTKLTEALDSAGYEISFLNETPRENSLSRFPYMVKLRITVMSQSISEQISEEGITKLARALASVGYNIIHLNFLKREIELNISPVFIKNEADT